MQLNYQNLNKTVQSFITTCDQKTKDVSDMFTNNSKTLDDLKDKSESMKSHVESMETDWPSIRDSTFSHNITITSLKTSIEEIRNTTKFIDSSISELRAEILKINNEGKELMKTNNVKADNLKIKKDDLSFLDEPGISKIDVVNKGINVPTSDDTSTAAITTTTVPTTKLKPANM